MPNTLSGEGGTVDLDILGMEAAPAAWPSRTVEHEYTNGEYETRYLGQSPATRTLTGVYSPVKPDYVVGRWAPDEEWRKMTENPGGAWTFSDDGVAYIITGLNADRRRYVNTQPYVVAWRIDLTREKSPPASAGGGGDNEG